MTEKYLIVDYCYSALGGEFYDFKSEDGVYKDMQDFFRTSNIDSKNYERFISRNNLIEVESSKTKRVLGREVENSNREFRDEALSKISGATDVDRVERELEEDGYRDYEEPTIEEIESALEGRRAELEEEIVEEVVEVPGVSDEEAERIETLEMNVESRQNKIAVWEAEISRKESLPKITVGVQNEIDDLRERISIFEDEISGWESEIGRLRR